MANPVFFDLTKDTWTLVASSVTRGQVSIIGNKPPQFMATYRVAGDVNVPVLVEDGIPMSRNSVQIESKDPIDVYIFPQNTDGRIRLDI